MSKKFGELLHVSNGMICVDEETKEYVLFDKICKIREIEVDRSFLLEKLVIKNKTKIVFGFGETKEIDIDCTTEEFHKALEEASNPPRAYYFVPNSTEVHD